MARMRSDAPLRVDMRVALRRQAAFGAGTCTQPAMLRTDKPERESKIRDRALVRSVRASESSLPLHRNALWRDANIALRPPWTKIVTQ